jgi:hypothetical protein
LAVGGNDAHTERVGIRMPHVRGTGPGTSMNRLAITKVLT